MIPQSTDLSKLCLTDLLLLFSFDNRSLAQAPFIVIGPLSGSTILKNAKLQRIEISCFFLDQRELSECVQDCFARFYPVL